MADPPPDEVSALLEGGPDDFVATRSARARALRAEGRKEDAAALAKVRKPLRLTWILIDVQHARPDVVAAAVEAAEDLARAQAGEGGRVRPLLAALRTALDAVAEAAAEVAPGSDGAQAGLLARQVVGDPEARQAWVEGRLLAGPEPDTEGGIDGSATSDRSPPAPSPSTRSTTRPRRARRRAAGPDPADRPEASAADAAAEADAAERTRREAQERAEAERRLAAARAARDAATAALDRLEDDLSTAEAELAERRARRDALLADVERARGELARTEAEVGAAEVGGHR